MSRLALLSGVATLVSGLHLTDELYNTFSPKNVESNQYVESELEFVLLGDGTRLKGIREDDVVTFKGIPYAEPPINELRWSPPVQWTNKNVTDIFDATRFRNSCIQGKERWEIGNEDCLYLNVYAPPVSAKSLNLLPVAVYIHGGSYVTGGGSMYSGKDLVSYWNEQAIVVTINYRLNVFGFLGSEVLRSQDTSTKSTGNYGLQDQRMAFEWVHKNIKYFGGDPRRMTIFGESAGAGSVSNHLTMKKSWGLFTGAILESGSFSEWIAQPMSLAEGTYQKLLDAVSCNDVNCLLSKSSEEIFDASISIPSPDATIYGYAYQPTVDGVEIMTHPWIALANGDIADVPIMHGTNSDEGSMFISLKEDATYEELIAYWKTSGFTDDEIPLLETLYLNQSYPSVPETSQYWWAADRSVGDYIMSCPAKYTSMKLGELTQRKSSTYLYHFEHVRNKAKYVSHFSEVPFVFRWEYIGYDTVADQDTCDVMSTFWGNFVVDSKHNPSSGHVGLTDLPTWTPYTIAADNLIRIPDKEGVQMISGLKYDECEFMIARLDKAIKEDYV